ncbi:MAG TPA: hypothetical protein VJV77_11440 [Casimicrobiaceae bacterium]|nr:hypothetical protein [Casimicrobiaceae bacterium]
MKSFRALLCLVAAFAVGGFVVPADAAQPTKKWSINMSPNQVVPGDTTLTATIKNETPNGNSSINSLRITLPDGYTLRAAPTSAWAGQIAWTTTSVSMSNMSPLKPLQKFDLTLPVTIASTPTCSAKTWTGLAWTGSSFSGDSFLQVFSVPDTQFPVDSTTTIGTNQALVFTVAPTNTTLGTTIPVSVKVSACGAGVAGTPVTITVSNCTTASGCLTGTTTSSTNASGVATFSPKVNQAGTFEMTASASGYPDAKASFTVYDGTLDCGDNVDSSFSNPMNLAPSLPGYSTGVRGAYNKDGTQCVLVPYTFTNTILTDDTVHLSWDTNVQASPAFMYSLNWRPRSVESTNPDTGWSIAPRPQVSWLNDGNGDPVFVPGLACLSGKLPAPYGTLQTAIDDQVTTITVTGIPANKADPSLAVQYSVPKVGAPALPTDSFGNFILPFPIVIGAAAGSATSPATERMTVTGIVSQSPATTNGYTGTYTMTFTVTRGTDAEGGAAKVGHAAQSQVMSTPLPIVPDDASTYPSPYVVKKQANMCVAEHGFGSFAVDANGKSQPMYFTTIIDIGDGWVRIGQ